MLGTGQSHWARADHRVPAEMPVSGKVEGIRSYGVPFWIPGTQTWISSLLITKPRGWFRDSDPFSEGGLAARGHTQQDGVADKFMTDLDIRWHNALFVDRSNGEHWSLTDQRAFFSHWWLVLDTADGAPVVQAMVFAATLTDTNGDGKLDNQDATVAVITDADGRHAQAVTPADAQLSTVHYFSGGDYLAFELRYDENRDGEFESTEPLRIVYLSLDDETRTVRPWQDADFEHRLEAINE